MHPLWRVLKGKPETQKSGSSGAGGEPCFWVPFFWRPPIVFVLFISFWLLLSFHRTVYLIFSRLRAGLLLRRAPSHTHARPTVAKKSGFMTRENRKGQKMCCLSVSWVGHFLDRVSGFCTGKSGRNSGQLGPVGSLVSGEILAKSVAVIWCWWLKLNYAS